MVPLPVLGELSIAMLEGALKYGRANYRAIGVKSSVYYDACRRHLDAYWEGQDIDPDSGLPHITKAIACLTVLRDSQMFGNCEDDRPIAYPDGWQNELNKQAEELIKRYPNPKEPYMQKDKDWSRPCDVE